MKYQYYNRIKEILENKENNLLHLEALEIMVSMYLEMFGKSGLSENLKELYNELEIKLKK